MEETLVVVMLLIIKISNVSTLLLANKIFNILTLLKKYVIINVKGGNICELTSLVAFD